MRRGGEEGWEVVVEGYLVGSGISCYVQSWSDAHKESQRMRRRSED
jgi:hypothetical protein